MKLTELKIPHLVITALIGLDDPSDVNKLDKLVTKQIGQQKEILWIIRSYITPGSVVYYRFGIKRSIQPLYQLNVKKMLVRWFRRLRRGIVRFRIIQIRFPQVNEIEPGAGYQRLYNKKEGIQLKQLK